MKTYRHRAIAVMVVALAAALLALPAAASAQTAATPLTDTTIQAQIWADADGQGPLIIVGATLPTSTPLPAVVELPVPVGASVQWAGEIEGTDPNNDVQVDYELVDAQGGQAVRFTVTQYRSFQYEAFLPSPMTNGSTVDLSLDWIQSVPSKDVSIAWKLPAEARNVVLEPDAPGSPATNEIGEMLYTLMPMTPGVGDTVVFNASYSVGDATTADGGGTSIGVLPVVIGLLVVAVIVLVVVISRQRQVPDDE